MRLIDADALDKVMGEAYFSLFEEYGSFDAYAMGYESAVCAVEAAPTIDAVPVVRCKDCRYWDDDGRCNGIKNGLVVDYTDEDDFCSYGEKRDE